MKTTVWLVSGPSPVPTVFGREAEADAFIGEKMREFWEKYGPTNEFGQRRPYPGDWAVAQGLMTEGSEERGHWFITDQEVEVVPGAKPRPIPEAAWPKMPYKPKDWLGH